MVEMQRVFGGGHNAQRFARRGTCRLNTRWRPRNAAARSLGADATSSRPNQKPGRQETRAAASRWCAIPFSGEKQPQSGELAHESAQNRALVVSWPTARSRPARGRSVKVGTQREKLPGFDPSVGTARSVHRSPARFTTLGQLSIMPDHWHAARLDCRHSASGAVH